jgi:hypothetical protein
MTDTYCYLRLKGDERDWQPLLDELNATVIPQWHKENVTIWGIWRGLFGVASNELVVMAAAPNQWDVNTFTLPIKEIAEIRQVEFLANTVRPFNTAPCTHPGLYVFRFFDVFNKDVDEIVRLSHDAWKFFENTDDYSAEPQGLFRQLDDTPTRGKILLVTWYDSLVSWHTSRQQTPAAQDKFMRRRALTQRSVALATQLVPFQTKRVKER